MTSCGNTEEVGLFSGSGPGFISAFDFQTMVLHELPFGQPASICFSFDAFQIGRFWQKDIVYALVTCTRKGGLDTYDSCRFLG